MIVGVREFFLIFGVLPAFLSRTQGQDLPQNCGKLRETQLHNEKLLTAPDEYTWIGRVGYRKPNNTETKFICLAVLIHQRFAILPVHCVLNTGDLSAEIILFGDWRANENIKVGDCRLERGFTTCSPPPQAVDIEEIAMHPQYEAGQHDYDIALAKMVRNVELSEFVQPLCLPPAREIEGNHISRRLEIAGFVRNWGNEEEIEDLEWRRKMTRHTTSLEFCMAASVPARVTFTQNHLCGVHPDGMDLMSGAPLMDVEVVDGKPRNFYLVAMNTFGKRSSRSSPISIEGFIRILPFRNWILKNIV